MDNNDPRLILSLEAVSVAAEKAWNQAQNHDRRLSAPVSTEKIVDISSRESTPARGEHSGTQIQLAFDKRPKSLEKGFVFGSDPQKCDVILGARAAGFSREHFRVSFNAQRQVIFADTSREETRIDYNGERLPSRNRFTWILFREYEDIVITMAKDVGELIFKVNWPDHDTCKVEYETYLDAYFEARRHVGVDSRLLPTVQDSPKQEPIYLMEKELGSGGFGTVYKAINVSTGNRYAAKKFHHRGWKNEVKILKSVSHQYIVEFVGFSKEQNPLLVMEYLPHGSLACQTSFTDEENVKILCQGLQALVYLHSRSPPLTHRDIKPENILVRSRSPYVIKLADFGLAKDQFILQTFCGSFKYTAPEIWDCRRYTAVVDIWSLGVVVYRCGYGLPITDPMITGEQWCRLIVQVAEGKKGRGDTLVEFVSAKMLRLNCRHRKSADDCLEEAYRLGFQAEQSDIGKTTSQSGSIKTHSVIAQPVQAAPSETVLSSRSESTEVAPSKLNLRQVVHFDNRASSPPLLGQRPRGTKIRNSRAKDIPALISTKRQCPQTSQGSIADVSKGQSKRPRPLISLEANKDLETRPERCISPSHKRKIATDAESCIEDVETVLHSVVAKPISTKRRSPLRRMSSSRMGRNLKVVEQPNYKDLMEIMRPKILQGSTGKPRVFVKRRRSKLYHRTLLR